jgi:hypothetical protein
MVTQGGRWHRRIQAAESAGRLLEELSVDQNEQIDVFGICEDLGLWLAFLPMDNLLGAFVPEGVGGVLVTTQRPIPVQRYTAAHEIGHWRLDHGHDLALDGEEHVLGNTPVEREQLAQVFAGNLLMPTPLVFGVLERLGVSGQLLEPEHAYAIAREAGVSYEAAVRQLSHLEVITPDRIAVLRQQRPLQVKAGLALGRRPLNGYADVWPVNEDWNEQLLALRVEDEVIISLPENRSTGYRWMFPGDRTGVEVSSPPPSLSGHEYPSVSEDAVAELRSQFSGRSAEGQSARVPNVVLKRLRDAQGSPALEPRTIGDADVVGDEYVPARTGWLSPRQARRQRIAREASPPAGSSLEPLAGGDGPVVGGTGRRVLSVRFARPGPATIRLQYRSPYTDDHPIERYVLHALVEPRRVGFSVDQLANDTDEPWAGPARQRGLERPLDPIKDDDELDADTPDG